MSGNSDDEGSIDDKDSSDESIAVREEVPTAVLSAVVVGDAQDRSIVRTGGGKSTKKKAPLWLITFTDVMALMLTFFVLLYSMAVPQEEKWEDISSAISSHFTKFTAKPYNMGSQDVVDIDKINKSSALDLSYLKAIISNLLKSRGIENVLIFQNEGRLVLSLPSELLFESGQANIKLEGKEALFSLGGALTRIKNRIEIVGNTDPAPIKAGRGNYKTNWELSLARGVSVASVIKEAGYKRPVTVRGVSSARFDELSEDIPEDKRYSLARRVDIIIMNDSGFNEKFYSIK